LVMQFSICMTKRATQPDHSLLSRSFQPEWTRFQVIQACRLLLYSKLTILFGNWWNKYDRTIVDQELRDPVSILCKSLNVQNLRDFDLINK
jgi:hypothetical protein